MPGQPIQIGPFIGGLNTFSDPTAIADNQLTVCDNFDLDLDGSLKSRPPFVDSGVSFPLATSGGNMLVLGYYYSEAGAAYLIASDGATSTYYFTGSAWTLITNTFAASAMIQFDNYAWLVAPVSSSNPGGKWKPDTFTADANMPKGDSIVGHKFRLWIVRGRDATTQGTRLYYSEPLGVSPFWKASPDFIDIGSGDGQNIVRVVVYYNNLLIFRTGSVYSFQYTSNPDSGLVSLVIPGVGLSHKDALAAFENYIYFMFDDRAYEFSNSRVAQLNVQVPFTSGSRSGIYQPYAVSVFNQRVIFSYFDRMYVFGLRTRTWTTWGSQVFGPIGKITALAEDAEFEKAVAHTSSSVGPSVSVTNLATNPSFTTGSGTVVVRTNLCENPGVAATTTGYAGTAGGTTPTTTRVSTTSVPGVSFRMNAVVAAPATYIDLRFGVAGWNLVTAGKTYVFSGWFHNNKDASVAVFVQWYDAANGLVSTDTVPQSSGIAGWKRVTSGALTAPVGAVRAVFIARATFSAVSGDFVGLTAVLSEEAVVLGTYFAGDTSASGDFTYAWAGTANASPSEQRAVGVAGAAGGTGRAVIQSGDWSASGAKSLRIIPTTVGDAGGANLYDVTPLRGHTITILATARLTAPQTGTPQPDVLPRAIGIFTSSIPTRVFSDQAPNTVGVHPLVWEVTVPADASTIRLLNGMSGGGGDIWWDDFTIIDGVYAGNPFSGDTADTVEHTYDWTGPAHASTSTRSTNRTAPVLFITDTTTTTDTEEFICSIQTKNYNYEASSIYKRLFSWGVDAAFRGTVTGLAVPITSNYSVSWGTLLSGGYTWGTILANGHTWKQPLSDTLNVETQVDTSGTTASRKFIKFLKSLRFRQIHFKVSFDTDGSTSSAPVRLFALMSYVKPKERVSKQVT